jgi:hypothetical protein
MRCVSTALKVFLAKQERGPPQISFAPLTAAARTSGLAPGRLRGVYGQGEPTFDQAKREFLDNWTAWRAWLAR